MFWARLSQALLEVCISENGSPFHTRAMHGYSLCAWENTGTAPFVRPLGAYSLKGVREWHGGGEAMVQSSLMCQHKEWSGRRECWNGMHTPPKSSGAPHLPNKGLCQSGTVLLSLNVFLLRTLLSYYGARFSPVLGHLEPFNRHKATLKLNYQAMKGSPHKRGNHGNVQQPRRFPCH